MLAIKSLGERHVSGEIVGLKLQGRAILFFRLWQELLITISRRPRQVGCVRWTEQLHGDICLIERSFRMAQLQFSEREAEVRLTIIRLQFDRLLKILLRLPRLLQVV